MSVSDPLVGRVLDGRYEILARVARGGMATVYRAHDRRLTRVVAVKVMHDGLGDDADFARKFDREARAAARLSNQHVVSVFDQGVDRGRPFIVMEFIEGCTLRHVITKEAPLEPLRALDLLEPVVHALASAHEAGLVHRDVKPENVLISDRGEIKVADFGLARAVTAQTATATQGLLIGTVSYLPPELVTSGRANARSDVYSTGVMLFEMLTGRKPHTGDTPIQVAWSHVHNDIDAPSVLVHADGRWRRDSRRLIPPYLDALVIACTRRQPASRPADARQLLHLLRKARQALSHGIVDDPALTETMMASTRHDLVDDETTLAASPASPARRRGLVDDVNAAVEPPPVPVSFRPRSASSPATTTTGPLAHRSTPSPGNREPSVVLDLRRRPRTPTSPVDLPTGRTWRRVADEDTEQAAARPARPRSQQTPIFPHMSHDPVHRRRRGLVALVLVLLLAVVAGGSGYWYMAHGRWTTAVAVQGTTLEQAEASAKQAGFIFSTSQAYSEDVPAGQVISTDPAGGSRVLKGSQIRAVVSAGPERFQMPDLASSTLAQATEKITSANLTVGKVTKAWHGSAPVDRVLQASQAPGAKLKRGTPIDLVISQGPRPITITDHAGSTAADATAKLTQLGFKVTSGETNHDSVAKGTVVSQSPNKGTGKAGDTIKLVVSKGPVMVKVPKVTGADEETAKQRLGNAGFKTKVVYNTEAWVRLNVVAAQDPGASSSAPKGSTVTLYVS